MVLRTNSDPAHAGLGRPSTLSRWAFPRPDFIELVFARFKLVDGTGGSFIFSHRIYGEKAGDQARAPLKTNAPATEKALMEWSSLPAPASLP